MVAVLIMGADANNTEKDSLSRSGKIFFVWLLLRSWRDAVPVEMTTQSEMLMAQHKDIDFFADNHDGLSPAEIIFCTAYASNGQNAVKAYLKAFPETNKDSAGQNGHQLLKKLNVRRLVNQKLNDRLATADLDMDWVQKRLKNIADSNIQDHFDPETGRQIPVAKLPRHVAATVSEFAVDQVGELRREKTKLYNAEKALATLGNMFKPEVQRYELTGKDGKPIGIEHTGGVLVIPAIACAETWAKFATISQDELHAKANEE